MTPEEFTKRVEKAVTQMLPELEADALKIGELVKKLIQKEILGHEHTSWLPLKEHTLVRKESAGHGTEGPLVRTGELRNSIFVRVGPREVTVGSNNPAAAAMEFGTSRGPPRPFIRLGAEEALPAVNKLLTTAMLKPFLGYGVHENPELGDTNVDHS